MTYYYPVYAPDDTAKANLLAVVGSDFGMSELASSFTPLNSAGSVFYVTETAQSPDRKDNKGADFSLIATSSEANVVNKDKNGQNFAYDAAAVADSMISTSAVYMQSNGKTSGYFQAGADNTLHTTVMNYDNYGLFWRFIGVIYQVPATPTPATPIPAATDKKSPSSSNVIEPLILTMVTLHLLFSVYQSIQARKNAGAITAANKAATDNPMNGL